MDKRWKAISREEKVVTDEKKAKKTEGLSQEELESQKGEQLPNREAMSLVNVNVAAPVNAAVAANVLSDDAVAIANAEQDATIDQSN